MKDDCNSNGRGSAEVDDFGAGEADAALTIVFSPCSNYGFESKNSGNCIDRMALEQYRNRYTPLSLAQKDFSKEESSLAIWPLGTVGSFLLWVATGLHHIDDRMTQFNRSTA